MKKKMLLSVFVLNANIINVVAQTPPIVYINFVTHNEPSDNLQNPFNYNKSKGYVQQLATMIDTKGAAWNLETCDGFATGALSIEGTASNILKTLANPPYNDNIEIDPRNKNFTNIADLYHVLDSLGANPTNTLGGFLYKVTPPATGSPDWFQYEDTISGITYPFAKWKCNLMWGAGSLAPHTADLNDYGIWKPDTTTNFYSHNSARSVWYIGNGCQPGFALDSIDDEQAVIDFIQATVDSVQTIWPQNKFYNFSVTFNQSQFGPMLFAKITKVIDSVNAIGSSKIQWKPLTQKFSAFQAWQTATGNSYSQWNCGDVASAIDENSFENSFVAYPNPANDQLTIAFNDSEKKDIHLFDVTGKLVFSNLNSDAKEKTIDISQLPSSIYFLKVETANGSYSKKIVVNH